MNTIPVLMYHNIGWAPRDSRVKGLFVSPRAFRNQLAMMKLFGYRGISMGEAMPYLRGERQGKVYAITFDDGYVDNLERALPILQRFGCTATCYVVSDHMGQYNVWDADRLRLRKPLMTEEQVAGWIAGGMELGAHTRRHVRLSTLSSEDELTDEIEGSKRVLEERFGRPVTQFCYPWGEYDERVLAVTKRAGFEGATTTKRGRARAPVEPLEICRIHVMRQHRLHAFFLKMFTRYGDRA